MGTIEAIRDLQRASPFVPYEIKMVSGEAYQVPHPDFVSVSPRGDMVIVYDADVRMRMLNPMLVGRVRPLPPSGKRRRRAG
jgi:hypothetical protein